MTGPSKNWCTLSSVHVSKIFYGTTQIWDGGEKENINIDHKEIYENINKEDF